MGLFKTDLEKYKSYSNNKSTTRLFLTTQGLWALYVYRLSNKVYRNKFPDFVKKPLLLGAVIWQKWIEIITGISIPYSTSIGHSLYLGHFGNIIINAKAVIGDNCNISQGVTIGVSGIAEKRGVPVLGNNIYIGANAVISGKIKVGHNVVVAANSLVTRDVEDNCTVMGVPAKKVSEKTSENYI